MDSTLEKNVPKLMLKSSMINRGAKTVLKRIQKLELISGKILTVKWTRISQVKNQNLIKMNGLPHSGENDE